MEGDLLIPLLGGLLAATVLAGAASWLAWRRADATTRVLMTRIGALSFASKLRLARAMASDSRVPLALRLLPLAMGVYLALPLDIVPDFVPVLGQLDDVLLLAGGLGLLLRFTPTAVLEEHVAALEARA
jgi:uncharacterized membrane protein YkvA (DUF1232 family)